MALLQRTLLVLALVTIASRDLFHLRAQQELTEYRLNAHQQRIEKIEAKIDYVLMACAATLGAQLLGLITRSSKR